MNRMVKIGLAGTGEIGQVHAKAHAEVEGAELCIAALIQPDAEKSLAEQYDARLYPSFEALLDDETVDAVDICLPNDLHRQFAAQALKAGKHVLCEKPIALSLDDADAMIEASQHADKFLMIGHVLRFWPEYLKAKEALDAGRVGRPLLFTARRMVSLLVGTRGEQGWRHDPRRSGGAVLDMQIHDLDAFCWFFGAPQAVVSRGIRSADGAISHVFAHLQFPDDKQAFVEASFMMQGNPLDIFFRILGTERSIEYSYHPVDFALHEIETDAPTQPAPSLMLYEWNRQPEPLYTPQTDSLDIAFREQVRYFAECVRTDTPPAIGTAEQAREALRIALASQESCESGETRRLDSS